MASNFAPMLLDEVGVTSPPRRHGIGSTSKGMHPARLAPNPRLTGRRTTSRLWELDPDGMIRDLALLALFDDGGAERVYRLVERLICDGMSAEEVVLDTIVPAARLLGEMWAEDTANFTEVSLAVNQLSTSVMRLEMDLPVAMIVHGEVLLTCAPGDQHGFASLVVGFCLRRHGWVVTCPQINDANTLVDLGERRHFDAFGLSIANDVLLPDCRRLIERMRQRTYNPEMRIVIGGPAVLADPGVSARLGADFSAKDPQAMVAHLEESCCGPGNLS